MRQRRKWILLGLLAVLLGFLARPAFHLARAWIEDPSEVEPVAAGHAIDASRDVGGRYYLPYRLHATVTQFREAYPQAGGFFALKRAYDPGELFQNLFYRRYGVDR